MRRLRSITAMTLGLAALCFAAAIAGQSTAAPPVDDAIHGPPARTPLHADLFGSNEIGQNGRKAAGDRNGRGAFAATIDDGKLCFGLTVANLDEPVAAHIHRGGRKVNGPVVVTLTAPSEGDPGTSSGCVDVSSSLGNELVKNRRRFYVNVHTEAFPGGAIRGQLGKTSR